MLSNGGAGKDSLRVSWTAGRSNQSILKEINPEYSLEGLMLKHQFFWSHDAKSWLTGKDPDAGKDWGQEEKGVTEDETVEWHHWLGGHEFEQALGDGGGQKGLACCHPWGLKESDTLSNWRTAEYLVKRYKAYCMCLLTISLWINWLGFLAFENLQILY